MNNNYFQKIKKTLIGNNSINANRKSYDEKIKRKVNISSLNLNMNANIKNKNRKNNSLNNYVNKHQVTNSSSIYLNSGNTLNLNNKYYKIPISKKIENNKKNNINEYL